MKEGVKSFFAEKKENIIDQGFRKYNELLTLIETGIDLTDTNPNLDLIEERLAVKEMHHSIRVGELDDPEYKRIIRKAIDTLNWVRELPEDLKRSLNNELRFIHESLPQSLDADTAKRLGLATKIYFTELLVSNIAEFGVDGILFALTLIPTLPEEVKYGFNTLIAYSLTNIVLPYPLPSTAGIARTLMHIFWAPRKIAEFNKINDNEAIIPKSVFRGKDLLLMFEGMGVTLLPFLTILRTFGLDMSFRAIRMLSGLKAINQTKNMYSDWLK